MRNTRVAKRYALALMSSAPDAASLDRTGKDLDAVARVLNSSRDLQLLLASPIITSEKKRSILKEVFGRIVSAETLTFINLLLHKRRENILAGIIVAFDELRDEAAGIVNAHVSSAVECTPAQRKALQAKLEDYTQKNVRLHFALDTAIKGGLLVKIGDTVLDASIRHQLELLRERLVA